LVEILAHDYSHCRRFHLRIRLCAIEVQPAAQSETMHCVFFPPFLSLVYINPLTKKPTAYAINYPLDSSPRFLQNATPPGLDSLFFRPWPPSSQVVNYWVLFAAKEHVTIFLTRPSRRAACPSSASAPPTPRRRDKRRRHRLLCGASSPQQR
jgi:hypothetical protein